MSFGSGDHVGVCYTWSGDKKKYEPDLFKAKLNAYINEYCYRYDSVDSKTLVFGKAPEGTDPNYTDEVHAYLPYGDLRINHNIQANGEDHYSLSGGYKGPPRKWSPPAGVDGPFDDSFGLTYPYYEHTFGFSYYVSTLYGKKENYSMSFLHPFNYYYYGNKK